MRLQMVFFLVLVWCGFSNNFTFLNIFLAIVVSIPLCYLTPKTQEQVKYYIRPWPLLSLLGLTIVELFKSSLIVTWDVLTPKHLNAPKILYISLACRNDVECTLLASLISLTPGTLSIDLTNDKRQLKVHVMFAKNPEKVIDFIKNKLEKKVMRIFKYGKA